MITAIETKERVEDFPKEKTKDRTLEDEIKRYKVHEMKRPMCSVVAAAELLMMQIDNPQDSLYKACQEIDSVHNRAADLIDKYLKASISNSQERQNHADEIKGYQKRQKLDEIKKLIYSLDKLHLFNEKGTELNPYPLTTKKQDRYIEIIKRNHKEVKESIGQLEFSDSKVENLYTLLGCLLSAGAGKNGGEGIILDQYLGDGTKSLEIEKNIFANIYNVLAGNAIQAMNPKGELTISADVQGEYFTFKVEDTGKGMPEHVRSKLEKEMEMVTHGKAHGTGFGLLSVKKDLDRYGGRLKIQSREGVGTKVTAYIPVASLAQNTMEPACAPA